ncbi:uncharacterized protein LOC141833953 [Curcuma longa]|uniref:uncharacterized protein LOC141833953 n=1 Tax=Curcuma longa TaxID=136217 RepID=UPI003D9DF5E0
MHVLEKLDSCGAIPITVSVQELEYLKSNPRAKYFEDAKPWSERCDIAFPCASQNEIDQPDAIDLVNSGCRVLVEGSNMPCTPQSIDILRKAKVLVAPAKAASAGGMLTVSLFVELTMFMQLQRVLVHGGNICAFLNIAHAMIDQGCV